MTTKQQKVYDYIVSYQSKHGDHPTMHEIRRHFRLASVNSVAQFLNKLVALEKLVKVNIGDNGSHHRYRLPLETFEPLI